MVQYGGSERSKSFKFDSENVENIIISSIIITVNAAPYPLAPPLTLYTSIFYLILFYLSLSGFIL